MKTINTFIYTILFCSLAMLSVGQVNSIDNETVHNADVRVVGTGTKLLVGTTAGVLNKLTVNAETGTQIARFRSNGNTKINIDADGNLAVGGSHSASAVLDVVGNTELNGGLRLVDGNQALGRILTSDATGIATWQDAPAGGAWTVSGANVHRATGAVGIGTATPNTGLLHIKQNGTGYLNAFRLETSLATSEDWYFFMDSNDDYVISNDASNYVKIQKNTGNMAIGTTYAAGYRLSVDGKIACEEVLVELSGSWPDYVFKSDYDLKSLDQVRAHIAANGHLPGVPSAQEVEDKGIKIGEMNKLLMEKVEELTLYILQQEENMKAQQEMINTQAKRLDALESNK